MNVSKEHSLRLARVVVRGWLAAASSSAKCCVQLWPWKQKQRSHSIWLDTLRGYIIKTRFVTVRIVNYQDSVHCELSYLFCYKTHIFECSQSFYHWALSRSSKTPTHKTMNCNCTQPHTPWMRKIMDLETLFTNRRQHGFLQKGNIRQLPYNRFWLKVIDFPSKECFWHWNFWCQKQNGSRRCLIIRATQFSHKSGIIFRINSVNNFTCTAFIPNARIWVFLYFCLKLCASNQFWRYHG